MRLLVIRHGESEADLLDVHEGRADFPLTQRGHRQAEALARYVKANYEVSAIYSSTLKRACQTAEHLSRETGVPVTADPMLMEFNNGLIAGMGRSEARERYPEVVGLPVHASVYGQESALEFRFRADYMLSKIIADVGEGHVAVVVTHGGMINQLYRSFRRLPVDCGVFFSTGDTGLHEWRVEPRRRWVVKSNWTGHAAGLLD